MTRFADYTRQALGEIHKSPLFREAAYIDGQWWAGQSARLEVTDPGSGAVIGMVPDCGAGEAREAIHAAQRVFPHWRNLLPQERAGLLRRWYELMLAHREELALIMTLEQGKPLAEARGEIDYAASFVEWYAEEAKRLHGETLASHLPHRQMLVQRVPVGVAVAFTPWNFPSAMITRKAAAALAAGCPMVVRPASESPFSALALAALAEQAGFPAGLFSVLTGEPGPICDTVMAAPEVRAVSFTGSTGIGKLLLRAGADSVKRMSMELGGHAPFILFDDVDLEAGVQAAIQAKFQTTGQDCLAANRIYVHKRHYEAFVARFSEATRRLRLGHGLAPNVDLGPLCHQRVVAKCAEQVSDALSRGARLTTGGNVSNLGSLFFEPTVLADVTPGMAIAREETFGPVAAILPFNDEHEVLRQANATPYGLVAYLYTNDPDRRYRMSQELEFGMVAVNCVKITGSPIPFGGVKESGLGREGGHHGLDEYTELKYVCTAFRAA